MYSQEAPSVPQGASERSARCLRRDRGAGAQGDGARPQARRRLLRSLPAASSRQLAGAGRPRGQPRVQPLRDRARGASRARGGDRLRLHREPRRRLLAAGGRGRRVGCERAIGKRISAKFVTIVDDGTWKGSRGSINVDDEGSGSAAAGKAILVTGFLGGNSNSTTGDFSHGIQGFLIEGGKRTRPIASMNIAGNHRAFWKGLQELGNDPYAHSSKRAPSLLFSPVLVSGT